MEMNTKPRCENCVYFHDKDVTSTGKILGYCNMKDSKRFGLPYGSLRFVVYGDGKCPYFKAKQQIEGQMTIFDLMEE